MFWKRSARLQYMDAGAVVTEIDLTDDKSTIVVRGSDDVERLAHFLLETLNSRKDVSWSTGETGSLK